MKNGNGLAELQRVREDLIDDGRRLLEDINRYRAQHQMLVKQLMELTDTKDEAAAIEKIRVAFAKPKAKPKNALCEGKFVEYVDKKGASHTALIKQVLDRGMLKIKVFGGIGPDRIFDAVPLSDVRRRDGWRSKLWR